MSLNELQIEYIQKASKKITLAQYSFWEFCKLEAPDFYTEDKIYLKDYCNILQAFHERKLLKKDGTPYLILIIEMPPRHGKTRTLVLFSAWLFGKDPSTKIISCSYNDDTATDFSRYTRDTIAEEKNSLLQIVYNDIFPHTKIKYGNASMHSWALEGRFFSYKGSGVGGTITGKGGNKIFVDDPVKNAEEAFNETHLNKLWQWYTGTLLSRKEHGAQQIINHTPWSKKDIGGRLQIEKPDDCYVFSRPAWNGESMLCPDILDETEYRELERTMEPIIFSANYNMIRVDVKGLLYGDVWKTYSELPKDDKGKDLTQQEMMWCDTADTGSDYLCAIFGRIYDRYCYVTDIYYTKDSVETTEPEIARRLCNRNVNTAIFEHNSGGHAISVHIRSLLKTNHSWTRTRIVGFTQTGNKIARILSEAWNVKERIIMPVDWSQRWPVFYKAVTTFLKEGKNVNDDGPDTLTQVIEYMDGKTKIEATGLSAGYLGL